LSATDTTSRSIARRGIERVAEELEIEALAAIGDDFDVFGAIDSFAVVELLMTTEALLEEAAGRYVPLADEKIFDAEHTPLRSFERWAAYIEEQRQSA
jgi:hypothetical protein